MGCDQCKSWIPVGHCTRQGDWIQSKDDLGYGKGECRINPPGPKGWPETLNYQLCGSFEPKMSSLDKYKKAFRLEENRALNYGARNAYLKKIIRDTGEEFGISRKKRPERILHLMQQKYFVLKQLEKEVNRSKKGKENDK